MTELTDEQRRVETAIEAFIDRPMRELARPWFTYEGPAGCGKSLLLAHIARKHPNALLCAFTGKAASVIARKSGLEASTIHSAIYAFLGEDKKTKELKFGAKVGKGHWHGELVLVDEVGTINEWLAKDLLATGCKVVGCGDRSQLHPVKGNPFFTEGEPDIRLTEIHRQALDSPIIRQAHSVRAGHGYHNDGPDFRIERHVSRDDLMAADVVLCWRNATRIGLNRLIRAHHDYGGVALKGEPVMALRNNPQWGILNGGVYTLLSDHIGGSQIVHIVNERGETVRVDRAWIEDMEGPLLIDEQNPFAFAYCCTVHKYQGSESPRVILVDEYDKQDQRERWLYTGITRASQSIVVQRFW